jgi:hypothetical protein
MAQTLLAQLKDGSAKFADVIAFIEARYQHTLRLFKMALNLMLQLRTKEVQKSLVLLN